MKKKNIFTIAIAAILVVVMAVAFTACGDDKTPETTAPETSSTEKATEAVVPTIEETEEETSTEAPTTEEVITTTEPETEAPKPKPTEAPTKAPETTKKQEPKPTEKPKETKPAKDEVNDFDTGELPTYPDGSINFGAIDNDKIEEENGGIVYF